MFYQHDELMRQNRSLLEMPVGQAPKFSDPSLQLPGGENYREVVLTMPKKTLPVQSERYTIEEAEDGLFKILNSNREVVDMEFTREAAEDAARQFSEGSLIATPGGSSLNFRGGHFPDEIALAHVRLNDRIDADGKKVLFIEEIQSDWHQKGRRYGYKGFSDNKEDMALLESTALVLSETRKNRT